MKVLRWRVPLWESTAPAGKNSLACPIKTHYLNVSPTPVASLSDETQCGPLSGHMTQVDDEGVECGREVGV